MRVSVTSLVLVAAMVACSSVFGGGGLDTLLLAAANGHVSVLQSLLDASADINAAEEQIGQQPLIWAAQMGHTEAVRVLLDVRHRYLIKRSNA